MLNTFFSSRLWWIVFGFLGMGIFAGVIFYYVVPPVPQRVHKTIPLSTFLKENAPPPSK